jgi:hypothetical protein
VTGTAGPRSQSTFAPEIFTILPQCRAQERNFFQQTVAQSIAIDDAPARR